MFSRRAARFLGKIERLNPMLFSLTSRERTFSPVRLPLSSREVSSSDREPRSED